MHRVRFQRCRVSNSQLCVKSVCFNPDLDVRFHMFEILEVATRKRGWEAKFLSTSKALERACELKASWGFEERSGPAC